MDKRSKILAGVFGVVVAYALLAGVVYPTWIKPLLTIDARIAERQADLDKLLKEDEAVQNARLEYKNWAARIGAFDAGKVETDVRERLNQLIERHKLADASVTPSRPVEDRKTGLFTSSITVTATGTLDSAVAFLKDVYELPHLTRVANASLSPVGAKKGAEKDRRVSVRVPMEMWVLPQHRVVGALDLSALPQPEKVARHQGQDYKTIVAANPFWDWVPPVPLTVRILQPVNVLIGEPGVLVAQVSGGDGEYTLSWSPVEGLSDPKALRTTVDTSKVGNLNYTLSVTDGTPETMTATTTVVVREVPKAVDPVPVKTTPTPVPIPVKEVRQRWPDGRSHEIKMALLCTMGAEKLNQFMVYNVKSKQNEYYKVGDDFDGGKLEFVHQYGGVVSWKDEFFVYPLGFTAEQGMELKAAAEYPELQLAAEAIKKQRAKPMASKPTPGEAIPRAAEADKLPAEAVTTGEPARQPTEPEGMPIATPVANPTVAPTAGGAQMVPLVTDPETAPTDSQVGPSDPAPVVPKAPVRPRPKTPSRVPAKPRP